MLYGMTVKEAKKILEEIGLNIKVNIEFENYEKDRAIITEQTPKEGIVIEKNASIICEIKSY